VRVYRIAARQDLVTSILSCLQKGEAKRQRIGNPTSDF